MLPALHDKEQTSRQTLQSSGDISTFGIFALSAVGVCGRKSTTHICKISVEYSTTELLHYFSAENAVAQWYCIRQNGYGLSSFLALGLAPSPPSRQHIPIMIVLPGNALNFLPYSEVRCPQKVSRAGTRNRDPTLFVAGSKLH